MPRSQHMQRDELIPGRRFPIWVTLATVTGFLVAFTLGAIG